MTSGADPWWASGSDESEAAAVDPDELLTAHRRARRGTPDADDDRGDGNGRPPSADHSLEVCGVCPICTGMRVLAETRPELAAHLTEAARHLTAAARTLLDEERSRRRPGPDPDDPLTRIDLD